MQKYKILGPPSKVQTGDLPLAMLLAGPGFHPGAFISGSYQLKSVQAMNGYTEIHMQFSTISFS
jgi:hypothetical protein